MSQDDRDLMEILIEEHHLNKVALEDEQGMQFLVLRHDAVLTQAPKPVLIWVHPGDSCEHDSDDEQIRQDAKWLEKYMGEEILSRLATHHIIVLHRQSSLYAFEPETSRVADDYSEAMYNTLNMGEAVQLWGDDLDEASDWVLKHFDNAPSFFLTGAWSHPDHGCVAEMGKALVEAGKTVKVSHNSPSDSGTTEDAWEPPQVQVAPVKKLKGPR